MLAGHEAHILYLKTADDFFELAKPAAPIFGIIGGMSQIAGKHYEIRLRAEVVHSGYSLGQRTRGVRVSLWSSKSPVRVRQLCKVKVFRLGWIRRSAVASCWPPKTRGENNSANAGEFQKISSIYI